MVSSCLQLSGPRRWQPQSRPGLLFRTIQRPRVFTSVAGDRRFLFARGTPRAVVVLPAPFTGSDDAPRTLSARVEPALPPASRPVPGHRSVTTGRGGDACPLGFVHA